MHSDSVKTEMKTRSRKVRGTKRKEPDNLNVAVNGMTVGEYINALEEAKVAVVEQRSQAQIELIGKEIREESAYLVSLKDEQYAVIKAKHGCRRIFGST